MAYFIKKGKKKKGYQQQQKRKDQKQLNIYTNRLIKIRRIHVKEQYICIKKRRGNLQYMG